MIYKVLQSISKHTCLYRCHYLKKGDLFMPALPILTIVMIFIAWLAYKIKSSDRSMQKTSELFWQKESQANSTRRQPLDSIPMITIPLDQLPILEQPDETIAKYQKQIQALSEKPIANLCGQTNTDLKMAYGAANLELLTEYDQNCTELFRTLYQWGQELCNAEFYSEAKTVLEFGLQCRTDISKHYTLLAEIYKQENQQNKISDLISTAEQLDSLMKPSILRALNKISESCQNPV